MLTVVTQTRFNRPEFLEQCKQSVAVALPPNAKHEIIHSTSHWAEIRYEATQLSEFVCFVDDDDHIDPTALIACLSALETSQAGLAITNEAIISETGRITDLCRLNRRYEEIQVHPRVIHHLAMMRRDAVDKQALILHQKYGLGIDWFLRASCALRHEAVQLDMIGYYWRIHGGNETANQPKKFLQTCTAMGSDIQRTWPRRPGFLPKFDCSRF